MKTFSHIDSTQLTELCRFYASEYYFENFALYNITWAEPRIVQCLYLLTFILALIVQKISVPNFGPHFNFGKKVLC